MAPDEGENAIGITARVLSDDIPTAIGVGDVGDNERATAGGGGEREENIKNVAGDAILFGDQFRRVVLDMAGLTDDLGEEGDVGATIERSHEILQRRGLHWSTLELQPSIRLEEKRKIEECGLKRMLSRVFIHRSREEIYIKLLLFINI